MAANDQVRPLEELPSTGWDYHDSESERLASELEAVADQEIAPAALGPFLHLSVHTLGEHLGEWPRALELGSRTLNGRTATRETAKAWGHLYLAAVLSGDAVTAAEAELTYLEAAGDEFCAALIDMRFMLVGALVAAKRISEAARLYRQALNLVGHIRQSPLLDRTIAIASNNLGWELYERLGRTEDEDALMQLASGTALTFWLKCGNWINEERALYLRAMVANATGRPAAGLGDAEKAISVINANGERPLDGALLHLARASSFDALGDVEGKMSALREADAAASTIARPDLRAQFDAERARITAP